MGWKWFKIVKREVSPSEIWDDKWLLITEVCKTWTPVFLTLGDFTVHLSAPPKFAVFRVECSIHCTFLGSSAEILTHVSDISDVISPQRKPVSYSNSCIVQMKNLRCPSSWCGEAWTRGWVFKGSYSEKACRPRSSLPLSRVGAGWVQTCRSGTCFEVRLLVCSQKSLCLCWIRNLGNN